MLIVVLDPKRWGLVVVVVFHQFLLDGYDLLERWDILTLDVVPRTQW